jgi:hypothetical protein
MGLFSKSDEEGDETDRAGFERGKKISSHVADTKRVIDEEAGVVLYAVKNLKKGGGYGLTAIPIDETDLERPGDEE